MWDIPKSHTSNQIIWYKMRGGKIQEICHCTMCVNVWSFIIRPPNFIILHYVHDDGVILMRTPKENYTDFDPFIQKNWLKKKKKINVLFCSRLGNILHK